MKTPVLRILLVVGLAVALVSLAGQAAGLRIPGNRQGYEPVQPIDYSHRLHAGQLEIPCQYCHTAADKGRYAGIPSSATCLKCHRDVTATKAQVAKEEQAAKSEGRQPQRVVSPELRKLYGALALDDDLQPVKGGHPQPIQWNRVHLLPDYVYFNHSAHVNVGVACQRCHGPVQSMERVRQAESLSMGWCVDCHRTSTRDGLDGRAVHASTDCSTCHY